MRGVNRHQRGGMSRKGEGANAAVILPAIPCEGESEPRTGYVSRVPLPEAPERFDPAPPDVVAILRTIDPEQDYFYYPVDCKAGVLTEENKKDGVTEETKVFAELLRYAPGGNSFDETGEMKPLTQAQKSHLGKAIRLLHANGVTHNDLHPGNVVFAEDNLPRIIDWQTARVVDRSNTQAFATDLATPLLKGGKRKTLRRKKQWNRRVQEPALRSKRPTRLGAFSRRRSGTYA